jgi:hypothetical protein
MNFLKKNWIIVSCVLIVSLCFCLIYNGASSFSYPKGGFSTILMLGIVFGTNFVFSKIKKRFGDKYTRRLDRIFVHIAVPVLIFTSFGFFQKAQINNAKKEMQSILENRIQGEAEEKKKNYDQVTYGELAPILQMVNDRSLVQAEKEKEYLNGLDEISEMINSENLCDKQSRHENKNKLDILLQGIEKYKAWMHSEIALREELFKKLGYTDNVLKTFRKSSQTSLSLNNEWMDSYSNLILSIDKIIRFVEKHQKNLKLVNETIEWDKDGLEEDFAALFNSMLDDANAVDAVVEKQIAYQQQMLEKTKGM